jgi:serine/threonine protein kinase
MALPDPKTTLAEARLLQSRGLVLSQGTQDQSERADKLLASCMCVHLKVAEDIGQGLLALHERGIVHRDLKPHNVLLTAQQRAKVSDMGHCKRLLDQQVSFESPGAGMRKAQYFENLPSYDNVC